MLEIVHYSFQGVPLLSLEGEFDHASVPEFEQATSRALGPDGKRLLMQLTDCPYIDSGGMSGLLLLLRRVRPEGWLGVIAPNADVQRLLELVGLTIDPNFFVFTGLDAVQAHFGDTLGCGA